MVGIRSLFHVLCAILIFSRSDSVLLRNEPIQHPELRANDHILNVEEEKYPFDYKNYSYKVESNELIKNSRLHPPIAYTTPSKYSLVLDPIINLCKGIDTNILTKFSIIQLEHQLHINIDEDLTKILNGDSTIVFQLKVIKDNDSNVIGGMTIIHISVVQSLPNPNILLEFEESIYSIKISYGRKGKVFKFKTLKRLMKTNDNYKNLKFEKYLENDKLLSQNEYSLYSLEYVPDQLLPKLRLSKDGDLDIIGYINEGFYNFDVVAVDFNVMPSTILKARTKVHLFVDNLAVCNSKISYFIKAFSKHYITEETKLQTVVPATGSINNCTFVISHQYPLGVGTDFFVIDPESGAVNVINPIDREAYPFEEAEEPSVYLRLKVYCPPPAVPIVTKPMNLPDVDNIVYDPTSTLVQLVIVDTNDNPPVFADKHITVGYPVLEVIETVVPDHLIQIKATDKDAGKHGKIQYSLRGENAEDFFILPETGTIYCTRPVDDSNTSKSFEVVAKDNDGKADGSESTLSITVKFLTYSDIIRVNVEFNTAEDQTAVESQLSDITGFRVMSLTNDVINTFADDRWLMVRTMIVYGVNIDGSLVSGSDLENKLVNNAKILEIMKYPKTPNSEKNTTLLSVMYAALFCLMLSIIALGMLYFGYVKNGRHLSCISSTSTTPLKDDMENMSQSNWITTFNRSNLSSTRVRYPENINSPVSQSKIIDHASTVIIENSLYEAIPPKGKTPADNSSIIRLNSKLSFEDDLIKLEKLEESFSPTDDDKSFNY